jgi:hypothetical protein
MQHPSIRHLSCTALLMLAGAFTRTSDAAAHPRFVNYYWYTDPGDEYNDYNSVGVEEEEMWIYYGAPVNTDPTGGTLIEEGYTNNVYPHEFPPSQFLYVHYPD